MEKESVLTVQIKNVKPIALTDLTVAMLDFSSQYSQFIDRETAHELDSASELYIKEVRSGCIIFELVSNAIASSPVFWEGGALAEYSKYLEQIFNWLLGKLGEDTYEPTKKDLQQLQGILEPVAKDSGSQMNIVVNEGGNVTQNFYIDSMGANAAQNTIHKKLETMKERKEYPCKKRVIQWHQTKFDMSSSTGDQAIIESISRSPIKAVFNDSTIKEDILHSGDRFNKPWHELAYVVDIEVQTIGGKPKMYTILKYYPEDTFDPH